MKDSPAKTNLCQVVEMDSSAAHQPSMGMASNDSLCLLVRLGDEGPTPKPDPQGCGAQASSHLLFSVASALGGQCIGTGVWGLCLPHTPTVPHLGRKNEPRPR